MPLPAPYVGIAKMYQGPVLHKAGSERLGSYISWSQLLALLLLRPMFVNSTSKITSWSSVLLPSSHADCHLPDAHSVFLWFLCGLPARLLSCGKSIL